MMKQFAYKTFVLMSVAGMALMVVMAGLSLTHKTHAQTQSTGLTLRLNTPKSSYLQLEAIPLTFSLLNPTTQSIKWQGIFTIGSDMDLVIQPVSGREKVIEGRMMNIAALASTPVTMQSGQEIESMAMLEGVSFFEKAFPSSGSYQVFLKFRYKRIDGDESNQETILSNPVTINIAVPQDADLEAYSFIKNNLERARLERAPIEDLVGLQRSFVDSYRSTAYGKQLTWKLALTYKAIGEDLKALRELCELSKDNTYYSKQAERMLNSIDVKLHPIDLTPLPENVPAPSRPHPCSRLRK